MDRSNVIYLIVNSPTKNQFGVYENAETRRMVYCNVSSVTGSEWFEGGRNGLNPQYRFTMFAPDYEGEEVLEYNGERYAIYRTYVGQNETIELYTEKKKGNEPSNLQSSNS